MRPSTVVALSREHGYRFRFFVACLFVIERGLGADGGLTMAMSSVLARQHAKLSTQVGGRIALRPPIATARPARNNAAQPTMSVRENDLLMRAAALLKYGNFAEAFVHRSMPPLVNRGAERGRAIERGHRLHSDATGLAPTWGT